MLHQICQLHDLLIQPVYFYQKILYEGFVFFAHCGHLQVLKVCDLKHLCLSQLCALKDRIINVEI